MAVVVFALSMLPGPLARAATVTLRWTAPGDDGTIGRATTYQLRYSIVPITEASFDAATPVAGVPAPGLPGSTETFTVPGLLPNQPYYFAIKTLDEVGNRSALSNVVVHPAPPPTAVGDSPASVSFSLPWPNPARDALRCAYALPRAATIQVDAFGADGRHVRCLAGGWRAAGAGEITWDLRDQRGRRVPAGVYFVRARLGDETWTRRAAVTP